MIELVIDTREQKILHTLSIPHRVEQLKHGDIQIMNDDEVMYVFERKTLADMRASINDGRYKNQKSELMIAFSPGKIYYIIEGEEDQWGTYDQGVEGAIINTMLRDKIGVFFSKDLNDTVQLIMAIWKRVTKDPSKYEAPSLSAAEKVVVPSTSKNVPPLTAMLCQIQGVSLKTASMINEKYASFYNMIKCLEPLSDKERLKELVNIGQQRKLSSTAMTNLLEVLFSHKN